MLRLPVASVLAVSCGLALPALGSGTGGELQWRYPIASSFLTNEPTVGADGSIYVCDSSGMLYAINPDGTEKWTADALLGQPGNGDEGPVAVFADGTVLLPTNPLGANTELVAFNADGSFKWRKTYSESIAWFAGPNILSGVGPGELAYAAQSGRTAEDQMIAVDSDGNIAWSARGNPGFYEENCIGSDMVFLKDGSRDLVACYADQNGDGRLYYFDAEDGSQEFATFVSAVNAPFMQHLQLQPAAAGGDRLYMTAFGWGSAAWGMRAFEGDGSVAWTYDPTIASEASPPEIGPDGTVFVAWDLQYFGAVEPDGSERWQIFDNTPIRSQPAVSPDGSIVVVSGQQNGVSGRVEAFDTQTGVSVWEAGLTLPEIGTVYPSGQPVFSNDGSAVYSGSSVFSGFIDGSFLYAFSTGLGTAGCNAADNAEPFGVLDLADVQGFITSFTTQEPAADLAEPTGVWDLADVQAFITGFNAGCP